MNLLVISSSLSKASRSFQMAQFAADNLTEHQIVPELINLRDYPLPICDGEESYSDPNVQILSQKIRHAEGILLSTPVYNYNVNAALKNLIELTGKFWIDKVVGFMCSAGGKNSYMSVMSLANSLMFDFRSVIIPRFVYVSEEAGEELSNSTQKRIQQLNHELIRFVKGLKS